MQQHTFLQGSPEWHAHRARARNASDAPAMLGCSPYTTRQQLLHALHTGLRAEASADQQRIFDAGHAIEAAQRVGAEEFIGEELFPIVGSQEVDGVLLSASFDGVTMTEETLYECKTLNADLRAAFADMGTIAAEHREQGSGKCLPKHFRVQMEQQLAVSGAQRVLFVAATKDGSDVRRCWYYPDPKLRAEIIAGWKQLDADLAAFIPTTTATPVVVAAQIEALPSVAVQVEGAITIRENFHAFEVALRDFLAHRLIREPKTDQDFADLDVQIKAMKGAEAALESAEAQMLAQIDPVSAAKRTKDMLAKLVRDNRLMAEKLLASEKERRRGEIVAAGAKALADHIASLNKRLGERYMPNAPADFAGVIRGKKSLASMEDAVATELARAKIAANETADRIQINMQALVAAGDTAHFPDAATLVMKAPDDLRAIIAARAAETQRKLDAERARIRAEEEARAQRQQQEREAAERRQREEAEALARRQEQEAAARAEQERQAQAAVTTPAITTNPPIGNVRPMPTKAPAAATSPPTLRLGEIQKRIAPLTIDAAGLAALGFPFAKQEGASRLWHESTFPAIVDAAIAQLARAKLKQLEAA